MTAPHTIQVCRECGGGAPVDVHFCPQCTKILSLGRQGDYFAFMGVPRRLNLDLAELERRFRTLSRQFHPDYFYNASPAERRASLERSSYLNDAYRTLKQPIARIAYLLELEGVWTAADRGPGSGTESKPGLNSGLGSGLGSGSNSGLNSGFNSGLGPESNSGLGGAGKQVPESLLEEVFALNEELDEIREMRESGAPAGQLAERLERARAPIERKRADHERQLEELSSRWDALLEGDRTRDAERREVLDAERRSVLDALRERMLERNYINNLLATIDREVAGSGLSALGSGPADTSKSPKPGA